MLYIDNSGHVDAIKIKKNIVPNIEHKKMEKVHGIVVHQTASPSMQSTLNSYKVPGANGAHFLIDKDGKIYQTASLTKQTYHVGLMKSRCLITRRCKPTELKKVSHLEKLWKPKEISDREKNKEWPERFPGNSDSIGIEIVGNAMRSEGSKEYTYESVNEEQNKSLKWLG